MATTHSRLLVRTTLGITMISAFALTSCATDERAIFQDGKVAASEPTETSKSDNSTDIQHDDVLLAEVDDPIEFERCVAAEDIDGATVEWLDDVVVAAHEVEGIEDQTIEVDGEEIAVPGVPAIEIPEIVGQAGCIIEYPAPGGCLPAIEISDSYIPGYRIPERTLEAVELPDGTVVEEQTQPALESESQRIEGGYQEQVCQTEPEDASEGEYVSHVVRPHIHRAHILAPHSTAKTLNRPGVLTDSGDFASFEALPSYQVPSILVGTATMESGFLESYQVEGADHTEYSEQDEAVYYTTEGDVLFDSDDHELRSDAESELQAIADDIASRDGEYTITVEGHTDDLPTQKYADNSELSKQRAESVVSWLQDTTEVAPEDITAEGMGDEHPRASNDTDEGRQENRRVVVTVTPTNYEPKIDFEVEDSETGDE